MKINSKLKSLIEHDIKRCREQINRGESEALFDELRTRYLAIDKNMLDEIEFLPKAGIFETGAEPDYRPELKRLAARLEVLIALEDGESTNNSNIINVTSKNTAIVTENPLKEKLKGFIARTGEIKAAESKLSPMGYWDISGPMYRTWLNEICVFTQRHLADHPLYNNILETTKRKNSPSTFNHIVEYLQVVIDDDEFWSTLERKTPDEERGTSMKGTGAEKEKVFIVHGHDNEAIVETARTLELAGFEAIILHEQPDTGDTIIEKIEKCTDVAFAVILYTPCDLGRAKEDTVDKFRARQNVVFEHGYLMSKLGRDHVAVLVKGDIETPGDLGGIVYTKMDREGMWKYNLGKRMKAVNLDFDLNSIK